MRSADDLPVELIDAIVDLFHDDTFTLSTVSLLNSTWARRSRYHLFRSLTIRGHRKICKLEEERPSASFTGLVTTLVLEAPIRATLFVVGVPSYTNGKVPLQTLINIIDLFPSLTSLTLRNVDVQLPPHSVSSTQGTPTPRVLKRLFLESVGTYYNYQTNFHCHDIHDILSPFIEVGELRLSQMSFLPGHSQSTKRLSTYRPQAKPLPFKTLHIGPSVTLHSILRRLRLYGLCGLR
ncbi:hypothetical protein NLI96_g3505 [Meripilus lineatus]|uniref:Uncharacterized protein n=1 Tax=Meripilus lineatus TaxID=2056292 RepID=A0AAD5V6M1_9APHY|nr:hypothetical protein NLI96_g3505 [Physisporinus lineatus]